MSHPEACAVPPTTAFYGFCLSPSASLRPSHHLRRASALASFGLRYNPLFRSVSLTRRVRDDRVDPPSSPQRTLSHVVHQTIEELVRHPVLLRRAKHSGNSLFAFRYDESVISIVIPLPTTKIRPLCLRCSARALTLPAYLTPVDIRPNHVRAPMCCGVQQRAGTDKGVVDDLPRRSLRR